MDIFEDFELLLGHDIDGELIDLVNNINPEREYNLRPRINHFIHWNDMEFYNRFRLSKATVTLILGQINDVLSNRTQR